MEKKREGRFVRQRFFALGLALALCLGLAAPGLAAGGDFVVENGVLVEYKGSGTVIAVPEGITEIGPEAFYRVAHTLEEVTLPQSLTKIGDNGFWGCVKLKAIIFPAGVSEIGANAFASCRSLTELTIPGTVKRVGNSAFMDCTALISLTIEPGVEELGPSAFWACTALTEAAIPDTVTKLGPNLLSDCTSLRRVVLPDNPQVAQEWGDRVSAALLGGCTGLEEIVNSPFTYNDRQVEANRAVMDGWVNPGAYVEPRSQSVTDRSNAICAGVDSDYDKARAIFRWVAGNVAYDYEHFYGRKAAVSNTAEEVLESRLAVCAGYTRLTQALLQAQGIPALYVSGVSTNGVANPRGSTGHAWNLAFVEGRWVTIDATWGRASAEDKVTGELKDGGGIIDEQWFDPKELFFSQSHTAQVSFSAQPADVPSDWARESVWAAICGKLVPNDLQGSYAANITREEFCRLMVTLVEERTGRVLPAPAAPFADTDSPAVAAAYAAGIVKGTADNTFTPGGSITRQEAAVMLSRTAGVLGLTAGKGERFTDAAGIAPWAVEGVAFTSGLVDSAGARVMGGTGGGGFSPLASYTREQAILTALRLSRCG